MTPAQKWCQGTEGSPPGTGTSHSNLGPGRDDFHIVPFPKKFGKRWYASLTKLWSFDHPVITL